MLSMAKVRFKDKSPIWVMRATYRSTEEEEEAEPKGA